MTADRDRFFFWKPEVKGREKYFGGTPFDFAHGERRGRIKCDTGCLDGGLFKANGCPK